MHRLKNFVFVFAFLMTVGEVFAQELSEKEMIGFGCWFSGRPTKTVEQGAELLDSKDFDGLRKFLFKNNTAKQFFGVMTLTELDRRGAINMTEKEYQRITEIKKSSKKIAFCSGCTVWGEVKLQKVLDEKNPHMIYEMADHWVKRVLKDLNIK